MRLTIFLVVAAIFGNAAFAENATDYYLVQYSPGDNWQERTGYTEQPGLGGLMAICRSCISMINSSWAGNYGTRT